MSEQNFSILILAAGKATRFKSEHSKMLHRLAGRLLGEYILQARTRQIPTASTWLSGTSATSCAKPLPARALSSSSKTSNWAPATR